MPAAKSTQSASSETGPVSAAQPNGQALFNVGAEGEIGSFSSAGAKPVNQDYCDFQMRSGRLAGLRGLIAAVADGISSSEKSAEASQHAVERLISDYFETPESWTIKTAGLTVISAVNAAFHNRNRVEYDVNRGHVCTLSGLVLRGRDGHIFHVGDSRVSRYRDDGLETLTRDHRVTVSGSVSYLSRGLGITNEAEIDYQKIALKPGDVFLLTTDGVHDFIDASDIAKALEEEDLDQAAAFLAQTALTRGSDDNLTVQLIRVRHVPGNKVLDLLPTTEALPLPPNLAPGDAIDGFKIGRILHHTPRSQVFMAIAPDGQQVAFKVLASDLKEDPVAIRRFILTDWITQQVQSAHVVGSYKPDQAPTCLYSVTEFFEGMTLRQWMIDHPKPDLGQVRAIVEQVIQGVRALHRSEIIHQDLHPENIMIDAYGMVKVIDLGAASVAGVEEAAPGILGSLPGTFQYTAPEYMSGGVVSWRSDQFSIAVIVYEMLTGRLPYGNKVMQVRNPQDQMRLVYQTAREEGSFLPVWMDQALQKASHPDPIRRYDALSAFMADLKRPFDGWNESHFIPLATRHPVRFWQGVSFALAILCIILLVQLGS